MNGPVWRVRPYRPGDERTLAALWTATFGRPMTDEHWRWKLKTRPAPVENVGIAVSADDRPIAQFAGIPCPAVVAGGSRLVMVGADVMTDPAYRRLGVFTGTARHLFERWREAGVALCYGLANDFGWGARAKALGFERSFALRWMVRPLRIERVLARRTGAPVLARWRALGRLWNRVWDGSEAPAADLTVNPMAAAGREFDAVWARAAPRVTTSLVRDRAWVTWRYIDFPGRAYRLTLAVRAGEAVGYGVYRVVRSSGATAIHVPEVFAPGDPTVLRALVRDLVARARDEDADTIVTLAVPGSELHRAFRRAGFVFGSGGWPVDVLRIDPAVPAGVVRDPAGWWVAGGDFDVI